ncbi:hypothetical protein Bca52824_011381 [Brassica carinata]|uniref:Uncharacterized protein n=1 Tax=Brassica carinata TaxID=52824 RepID=A0A8X7WD41_BRACI|nr:hypothetical protein Bca52824_011381 [Brassica carinata]
MASQRRYHSALNIPLLHHCIITAKLANISRKRSSMSKRSGSSVPLTAERLGSRRRTDSPVSKSGSSSDSHDESGHKSLAPAPLSYASLIPPLGTHPAHAEGESNVTRARALPIEHRQVAHLISSKVLRRSCLWYGMAGGDKEDPITAFKRATDALSAKRGIIGGIVSDDEVVITGSRSKMMVKAEATSSSHGRTLRDRTTSRSLPQSSGAEQTPDGLSSVLVDTLWCFPETRPFFRAMILRR